MAKNRTKKTALSLRIPEPLRTRLKTLAESTGRSEVELVREAIAEYLLRHAKLRSCYDLAQEAGIIGCVNSGRRDLSTNPKRLQRFGR